MRASQSVTPISQASGARLAEPDRLRNLIPADGRPVLLDLGCGKGRFLRARAAACPETWFIGIDRMALRLQRLAARAERDGLRNVRLLRCDAYGALFFFLPAGSISVCTVFFPDPWPKRRHHCRRLITPAFLDALHRILVPDGRIFLATDHADYFLWMARTFQKHAAFRPCPALILPPEQQTDFERLFTTLNHPIYRCAYQRIG